MSESEPPPEFGSYELYGESLSDWHHWLTSDHETGQRTGHLRTPCSRYGMIGDECAWWAIAGELVDVAAVGPSDDPGAALDHLMALAVNDWPDLAVMVDEYWDVIPPALQEQLGTRETVQRLIDRPAR